MEKIFQDPSIVQYILEKLFQNTEIYLEEPPSTVYYPPNRKRAWRLLRHAPRIVSLQLVSKSFYLAMKTTKFRVHGVGLSRPMLGHDPFVPVDLGTPMGWLEKHVVPYQMTVPSVGNGFSLATDTLACGIKENMLDAEYVNIERLDGLVGFGDSRILQNTKKLRIGAVGHTGMVSRMVAAALFQDSQNRAIGSFSSTKMVDMGSIQELKIDSPLPVRVYRNHMDGRIEYYMKVSDKPFDNEGNMSFRSMNVLVKNVFDQVTKDGLGGVYSGVHSPYGNVSLKAYKFHRDLGNVYLSNLDFNGIQKLTIRAYECLGPPVGYSYKGKYDGPLRVTKALMHDDPGTHMHILEDLKLLLSDHVGDMSLGNYYPGYRMMMNMVCRSKNLEEIIYTGVRQDALDIAIEVLKKPWVQLSKTLHEDGITKRKPFKVYVQTMWYRQLPGGYGKVAAGITPNPNILIFDSTLVN